MLSTSPEGEAQEEDRPVTAADVIVAAGGPAAASSVAYGRRGDLLVVYGPRLGSSAWRLFGAAGRMVAEGTVKGRTKPLAIDAAGPGFVFAASFPTFVIVYIDHRGHVRQLQRKLRDRSRARPHEIWYGDGDVLDLTAGTVRRPRLPGCAGYGQVDRSGRIWCTDPALTQARWSDDGGRTWSGYRFPSGYGDYSCDGGKPRLSVSAGVVAITGYTIDYTLDRGHSWHRVELPAHVARALGLGNFNCPRVTAQVQGRLLIRFEVAFLADDPSNTTFTRIDLDLDFDAVAGVPFRPSHRRRPATMSFDAGTTWRPFDPKALLGHLGATS